jgi:hypothetical protein
VLSLLLASLFSFARQTASAVPGSPVYLPMVMNNSSSASRVWPDTRAAILPFDDQVDVNGLTETQVSSITLQANQAAVLLNTP